MQLFVNMKIILLKWKEGNSTSVLVSFASTAGISDARVCGKLSVAQIEGDRGIGTQLGAAPVGYTVPVSACINTLNRFNVSSTPSSGVTGPETYDIVRVLSANLPQGRQIRGARHNLAKGCAQSAMEQSGSALIHCS
jgi:hypothetical protein